VPEKELLTLGDKFMLPSSTSLALMPLAPYSPFLLMLRPLKAGQKSQTSQTSPSRTSRPRWRRSTDRLISVERTTSRPTARIGMLLARTGAHSSGSGQYPDTATGVCGDNRDLTGRHPIKPRAGGVNSSPQLRHRGRCGNHHGALRAAKAGFWGRDRFVTSRSGMAGQRASVRAPL